MANPSSFIVNDPIYGLIHVSNPFIQQLINHRFFQRLRRINQLGSTHFVYPGATHSRFSHSIGAMYLTIRAIQILKKKGVKITPEEEEATTIAILFHDLGHGPFSHSLEHHILNIEHEYLSNFLMEELNTEFSGRLDLALSIFNNKYSKKFLCQLISGQLDMDRMDYLIRDSFYTGVQEGRIGYDRILETLNVFDDDLVLEFKGIYSVEQFIIARRLMYWQVYLHKNVICAGEIMCSIIKRARYLIQKGIQLEMPKSLFYFLEKNVDIKFIQKDPKTVLESFYELDDSDIMYALKVFCNHDDFVLSYLSRSIIERKFLKIMLRNTPIDTTVSQRIKADCLKQFPQLGPEDLSYLVIEGNEANQAYSTQKDEIMIMLNNENSKPISQWQEHNVQHKRIVKYFICYPRPL